MLRITTRRKEDEKQVRRLDNEHKYGVAAEKRRTEILQLESVNVLAKYQLVLVKLRAAVAKVVRIARARDLCRLQRAFGRYRGNVAVARNVQTHRARMLLEQMQTAIQGVARVYRRKRRARVLRFMERWRHLSSKAQISKELTKRVASTEERHKKELSSHDRKLATLEQKTQQQGAEAAELQGRTMSLKQAIANKEEKEHALRDTLERVKKHEGEERKLPQKVEEKLRTLETHMVGLEAENKELRERLESTESSVGGFVQEVSEVLDSQEFAGLCK